MHGGKGLTYSSCRLDVRDIFSIFHSPNHDVPLCDPTETSKNPTSSKEAVVRSCDTDIPILTIHFDKSCPLSVGLKSTKSLTVKQ